MEGTMTILAVDPSLSRTGICLYESGGGYWLFQRETSPRMEPTERTARIYSAVQKLCAYAARSRPGAVVGVVEGMAISRAHSSSFSALAEVSGLVKLAFWEHMIPHVVAPQSWWKSVAVGKRLRGKRKGSAAEREEYLKVVRSALGEEISNVDAADAYMMAVAVDRAISGRAARSPGTDAVVAALERQGVRCLRMQPMLEHGGYM